MGRHSRGGAAPTPPDPDPAPPVAPVPPPRSVEDTAVRDRGAYRVVDVGLPPSAPAAGVAFPLDEGAGRPAGRRFGATRADLVPPGPPPSRYGATGADLVPPASPPGGYGATRADLVSPASGYGATRADLVSPASGYGATRADLVPPASPPGGYGAIRTDLVPPATPPGGYGAGETGRSAYGAAARSTAAGRLPGPDGGVGSRFGRSDSAAGLRPLGAADSGAGLRPLVAADTDTGLRPVDLGGGGRFGLSDSAAGLRPLGAADSGAGLRPLAAADTDTGLRPLGPDAGEDEPPTRGRRGRGRADAAPARSRRARPDEPAGRRYGATRVDLVSDGATALAPRPDLPEPDEITDTGARRARSTFRVADGVADRDAEDPDADDSALLLQWVVFLAQTLTGAAVGLGVWLGFYRLWSTWPFYAAPAVGLAMICMLVVARTLRRRHGHDLDLLTAIVTIGVGTVLTVLPATFTLQNLS